MDEKTPLNQVGIGKQNIKPSQMPSSSDKIKLVNNDLNTLSRRIRMLEERYYNVRKKTQLTDQNMLDDNKRINTQLKYFTESIKDLKRKIDDIGEKLEMFDEELNDTAKKRDLTIINKYLDFWEPINFLTEKDALKIISDILDELNISNK